MKLTEIFTPEFFYQYGGILIAVLVVLLIGIVAKWRLFVKCGQPGLAALVPGWDIICTLRIVGRPLSHFGFFFIPGVNIIFGFILLIDLARAFGKTGTIDYVLVILFNMFYILNLGLAYNEEYQGPVFQKSSTPVNDGSAHFA